MYIRARGGGKTRLLPGKLTPYGTKKKKIIMTPVDLSITCSVSKVHAIVCVNAGLVGGAGVISGLCRFFWDGPKESVEPRRRTGQRVPLGSTQARLISSIFPEADGPEGNRWLLVRLVKINGLGSAHVSGL